MRIGDLLEFAAAGLLCYGIYRLSGLAGCLIAAGVAFAYFAQMYDAPIKRRRPR